MMSEAFDTLSALRDLEASGLDPGYAEAIVQIVSQRYQQVADKADFALLRGELTRINSELNRVNEAVANLGGTGDEFKKETTGEFTAVRKEMAGEFTAVRQEMAEGLAAVRKEMTGGFAAVRQEMAGGFAAVRQEMAGGFTAVRQEMAEGFTAVRQETNDEFAAIRQAMRTGFANTVSKRELDATLADLRRENKNNLEILHGKFSTKLAAVVNKMLLAQVAVGGLIVASLRLL